VSLRAAHDRNGEKAERIFFRRRFRNDSERLEKLFTTYTEMTSVPTAWKRKVFTQILSLIPNGQPINETMVLSKIVGVGYF